MTTTTMTATEKTVRYTVRKWDLTVDNNNRILGCYLEDGSVATIADLCEILDTHKVIGLVSFLADNARIHG